MCIYTDTHKLVHELTREYDYSYQEIAKLAGVSHTAIARLFHLPKGQYYDYKRKEHYAAQKKNVEKIYAALSALPQAKRLDHVY